MKNEGTNAVGAVDSYRKPVVSRTNAPLSVMVDAPISADHPSRRPVAAGFQKMSEASEQPPPVTAKLRPTAHEPISLSAKPCAPANCGSRSTAADSSNDRVARRSNMTILQKV